MTVARPAGTEPPLPVAVLDRARGRRRALVVALLPDTAILTLTNIPVEPIALIVASRSGTWRSR